MLWARFRRGGHLGYGQLEGDSLTVYSGDIFSGAAPTGQSVKLAEVELLTPCDPSKMICLWNNFHALAAKLEVAEPPEPLYFLKAPSAFPAEIGSGACRERVCQYGEISVVAVYITKKINHA